MQALLFDLLRLVKARSDRIGLAYIVRARRLLLQSSRVGEGERFRI